MAGSRGRFRGRHGLGRGTQAEHRGRGGNAAVGRGPPDRTAQDAVHQGSAPAASAASRGGDPPPGSADGRGAAPRVRGEATLGAVGSQKSSRVGVVVALSLTQRQLPTPRV
jgi:hypothetical protein